MRTVTLKFKIPEDFLTSSSDVQAAVFDSFMNMIINQPISSSPRQMELVKTLWEQMKTPKDMKKA